ncbi:MAG: AMP-binding protein, partial [Acidimicrobiales bacterium]
MQGDILLLAGRADPAAPAVDDGRSRVSWAELESRARRAAHALLSAGVSAVRPWALLSHNRVEWVELWLANPMAGARHVPLNWHLTAPELAYLLTNSGSVLLVVEAGLETVAREAAALAGLDGSHIVVIDDGYSKWRDSHPDTRPDNDTAGAPLQYTGGTTGASKGVVRPDHGLP